MLHGRLMEALSLRIAILGLCLAAPSITPASAAPGVPRAEIVLTAGHTQGVNSAVFSFGNDRFAATSGDDGMIKLWSVDTGRLIRNVARIDPNAKYWRVTALSRDGTRLSGVAGGEAKVWDTLSGREIFSLTDPVDDNAVVMSPDGARIAVRGNGKTVKLIDGSTGRELTVLKDVVAVSFSPDGRAIVAGRSDRTVDVLDAANGMRIHALAALDDVMAEAVHADGGRRISIKNASGLVTLWDLQSSRKIAERRGSKDAEAVFSADGAYWAFAGGNETVEVLNVETGAVASTFKAPAMAALGRFSTDNVLLLFTPRAEQHADWALTSVRAATGEAVNVFKSTGSAGWLGARFYMDGDDGDAGTVRIRDIESWREVRVIAGQRPLKAAAFSRDGARVALSRPGEISVLDAETGQRLGGCPAPSADADTLGFAPDGRRLAYGGEGNVTICDWEKQAVTQTFGKDGSVKAVSFSADGRQLITGNGSGDVRIWDIASGRNLRTFKGNGRSADAVAFSPDARRAFSGTDDNRVHIWNLATGREEQNLRMLIGPVSAMAISPDGRRVAATPYSQLLVKQWNVETGQELRRLESDVVGRFVMPADVKFSTSGDHLLAAICNNQFVVWDADSGQRTLDVSIPDQDFKAVAFSGEGRRLATVDDAGAVRHWDRRTGALLVTVFPLGDGGWLRLTPEGFFDASPNAAAGLSVVRGLDVTGIVEVGKQFDRPDLVREKLAGDAAGRVREAASKLDVTR
jgi:WD40 repeat protein